MKTNAITKIDYDLLKDKVQCHCKCPRCGTITIVELEPLEYDAFRDWEDGKMLIQDALPRLSDDERECLKTGICKHCWDEIFSCDETKEEYAEEN